MADQKRRLREVVLRRLAAQEGRMDLGRRICRRLMALPGYRNSRRLCTYVSLPTEVQTLELIESAWADGKQVAVPCCRDRKLHLFHLKSMDELAPRTLGILEPREEEWQREDRWLDPAHIDLFIVPGIAFDRSGGRLGHGRGYYDQLLEAAGSKAVRMALAFECQLVDSVPMTERDVFMHHVITEESVHGV